MRNTVPNESSSSNRSGLARTVPSRYFVQFLKDNAWIIAVLSLLVSVGGYLNSREQIKLTRKLNVMDIRPRLALDMRVQDVNSNEVAVAVFRNPGPLKVVSVDAKADVFVLENDSFNVVPESEKDYFFDRLSVPALEMGSDVTLTNWPYVPMARNVIFVEASFYREKDMERFEEKGIFLIENDRVVNEKLFRESSQFEPIMRAIAKHRRSGTIAK